MLLSGEGSELTAVVIFVILPGCENNTPFEASIYNKISDRYMLNSFVMFMNIREDINWYIADLQYGILDKSTVFFHWHM